MPRTVIDHHHGMTTTAYYRPDRGNNEATEGSAAMNQVADLQKENKELTENLFDSVRKNNQLEEKLQEKEREADKLRDERETWKKKHHHVKEMLMNEIKGKMVEIRGLNQQVEHSQTECYSLIGQREAMTNTVRSLQQEKELLAKKNKKLENKVGHLLGENFKLKYCKTQTNAVTEESDRKQEEIDEKNKASIQLVMEAAELVRDNIEQAQQERHAVANKKRKIQEEADQITDRQDTVICQLCGKRFKRSGFQIHMGHMHPHHASSSRV